MGNFTFMTCIAWHHAPRPRGLETSTCVSASLCFQSSSARTVWMPEPLVTGFNASRPEGGSRLVLDFAIALLATKTWLARTPSVPWIVRFRRTAFRYQSRDASHPLHINGSKCLIHIGSPLYRLDFRHPHSIVPRASHGL